MDLLNQCGWLSVKQLVSYHGVILIYKTIKTTYPKYLFNKLSMDSPYNTRLAQSESVRMGEQFKSKLDLNERRFLNRATINFNQLPAELRQTTFSRLRSQEQPHPMLTVTSSKHHLDSSLTTNITNWVIRQEMRTLFRNLKIIIIVEVSMVRSDMIYQLDPILQELKERVGIHM